MTDSHASVDTTDDVKRFRNAALNFTALCALTWLALYGLEAAFPYVRPGSDVIHQAKDAAIAEGGLFPADVSPRVVVVGNSRTLSGFNPAIFEARIGGACHAYNLGFPGTNEYIDPLKALIDGGDVPTHVLIQAPWPVATAPKSFLAWLRQDAKVMQALFPFRDFPRNLAIFIVASASRGGMAEYYRRKQDIAVEMVADRGYYFIEGQSRYEGHRLPDSFTLPSDTPNRVYEREFRFDALAFQELLALAETHGIRLIIIPEYYRANVFAEPPAENRTTAAEVAKHPAIDLVGPDYFRYPNAFFSDAVHLNRAGAEVYTRQLAERLTPWLEEPTPLSGDDG